MREPRTARAFGIVLIGAVEKEIQHFVGTFDVNACLKSIVLEPNIPHQGKL